MPWDPTELNEPLRVGRMLQHIKVLVNQFPPGDAGLLPAIQGAADDLLSDPTGSKFKDKFEARCIRVYRAYAAAGRAVNAPASNRNGPWNDCKDELEHAQAGD